MTSNFDKKNSSSSSTSEGLIPDLQIRDLALDVKKSFLVQAPAGSGKTELLTRRFIHLLNTVEYPEQVVALTFTRKAASEMRDRVLSRILETQEQDIDASLREQISKIREKNAKLNWHLESQPSRLRIMTIDSFCSQINRLRPFTDFLGRDAKLLETEDFKEIAFVSAKRAMDSFVSDYENEAKNILEYFHNDVEQIYAWCASMLQKRESWIRQVINLINLDSKELEDNQRAAVKSWVSLALSEFESFKSKLLDKDFLNLLDAIESRVFISEIKSESDTSFELVSQQLMRCKVLSTILLTAKGTLRKSRGLKSDIEDKENNIAISLIDDEKKALKEQLDYLHTKYIDTQNQDFGAFIELLIRARSIPSIDTQNTPIIFSLMLFLRQSMAQMLVSFRENSCTDYSQNTLNAIDALSRNCDLSNIDIEPLFDENIFTESLFNQNHTSADIGKNDFLQFISEHIHHILVDEFQDNSSSQFQMLRLLTVDWQEGSHSIFFVGDPMQSIYSFRQAQVGNFLALADQENIYWNNLPIIKLTLQSNFRSSPQLVNWFNETFSKVFYRTDLWSQSIKYNHSISAKPVRTSIEEAFDPISYHGYLVTRNGEKVGKGEKYQVQAHALKQLVLSIKQKSPNHSIAVLSRKKDQFIVWENTLSEVGIDANVVVSNGSDMPQDVVDDVLILLKSLVNPLDKLSICSWLRSPMIGLSLQDIYYVVRMLDSLSFIDLSTEILKSMDLSTEGRQRLSWAISWFEELFSIRQVSWYQAFILIEEVLYSYYPLSSSEKEKLERLKVLVLKFSDGYSLNLYSIGLSLNKKSEDASLSSSDAIQIMTIHASKGLQFDTVILMETTRSPKGSGFESSLINYWQDSRQASEVFLIAENSQTNLFGSLRKQQSIQETEENKRLLYVAMTRAKENIHIIAMFDPDKKDISIAYKKPESNCLYSFLSMYENYFVRALESVELGKTPLSKDESNAIDNKNTYENNSKNGDIEVPDLYFDCIAIDAINMAQRALIKISSTKLETSTIAYKGLQNDIKSSSEQVAIKRGMFLHFCLNILLSNFAELRLDLIDKPNVLTSKILALPVIKGRFLQGADQGLESKQKDLMYLLSSISSNKEIMSLFDMQGESEVEISHKSKDISGRVDYLVYDSSNDGLDHNSRVEELQGTFIIVDFKMSSPRDGESSYDFLQREKIAYKGQLDTYAQILISHHAHAKAKRMLCFPLVGDQVNYIIWAD